MINLWVTGACIEIQNGCRSDGQLCNERVLVRVCDAGAGPFLAIKTENLEASEDYDAGTITVDPEDLAALFDALRKIIDTAERGQT